MILLSNLGPLEAIILLALSVVLGIIVIYLAIRFIMGFMRGTSKVVSNVASMVEKVGDSVEDSVSLERKSSNTGYGSNIELLHKLSEMKEKGLITHDEFEREKKRLLS